MKTVNRIVSHFLAAALIILAVVICYHHTVGAPFVFDDRTSIMENEKITHLSNFYSLDSFREQRPLTEFTFALNYQFAQLKVDHYRLVNIGIHILTSLLAYVLALQLLTRSGAGHGSAGRRNIMMAAAFAALVFAVHPVQTQAVTYVVQRYTSMSALFYMAAVLLYIYGRGVLADSGTRKFTGIKAGGTFIPLKSLACFGLCFISAVAAFLSKQSALSLPLMIIFIEYAFFDRTWAGWKKKLVYLFPAVTVFLVFVLYSTGALHGGASLARLLEEASHRAMETQALSRVEYLLSQFRVIPAYMGLLFWPANQNVDHMYPFVTSLFQSWTFWGMLLLILVAGAGLAFRNIYPAVFAGIFWFYIALSVESSLIPIRDAMFEHRLYLPMFGFALIAGFLLFKVLQRWKYPAVVAGLALLAVLCVSTHQRNALWLDPVKLWADSVAENPANPRAQYNYGRELALQGRVEEALQHFHKSLDLRPEHPRTLYNAGLAYQELGEYDQALEHYLQAAENDPGHVNARLNAAVVKAGRGKLPEAADMFEKVLHIEPDNADAMMNLAVIRYELGQRHEAASMLEQLLEKYPENLNALLNMGIISMELGRLDKADEYLTRAYRLQPGDTRIMQQMNRLRMLKNRQ